MKFSKSWMGFCRLLCKARKFKEAMEKFEEDRCERSIAHFSSEANWKNISGQHESFESNHPPKPRLSSLAGQCAAAISSFMCGSVGLAP